MREDTALEAQIRADPSDVATHLVYADLLQGKGDPYGELIVLQHELAANPTPALAKREQAWFARNYFEVPDYYRLTWQLGFVRAATIHVKVGYLRHAVEFLTSPAFKFLRTLRIEGSARGAFAIADDLPVDVDDLVIATREEVVAKDVKDVVAKRPGLRRLEISARRGFDGPIRIASPTLVELVLHSRGYDGALELAATTPALRSLIVSAPEIGRATIAAALDRRWPLHRLGLFADGQEDLEARLVTSKVWPGLAAVGFVWNVSWFEPGGASRMLEGLGARAVIPDPFANAYQLESMGEALRDAGRLADALACFELAAAGAPDDPDMWLHCGLALARLGRAAQSLAHYRRATQVDPDHFLAHYLLAFHHHDANEPALALEPIVKACKLDPDHAGAWHVRGRIEHALGKPAKTSLRRALRIYEQTVAKQARDAESWFQLACVRAALGEREACLETLAHAIALDPNVKQRARTDPDLAALRDDPELQRLTV